MKRSRVERRPYSLRRPHVWPVVAVLAVLLAATPASAQRNLRDIPDPDPEIERQSFQVAEGFEVNLFAADPLLAKPIQINFDSQGRLWVASSEVYPHVKPGEQANDKILILEDADGDGSAESTTVFADGLLIPTGVEPGDGGAYVANSTELVHFRDTDGDGRADQRRVMLSGFGTEDTHHILHTFRWGHDGMLYFNQSIYIHSHIETPHGVRRLGGGGIWQFRPETMQLEVFMRGLCNPWGHHFDYWGQSFATDGAGGEGINYTFPGAVMFTFPGATKILQGLNPGSPKDCGLEFVTGRHLPEDWQETLVTNDFRAHRVVRYRITEDGSGYAAREQPEVIKTTHAAFRPVDVKMGPDGAIYIADWYNPIIQHGEVDFRDPRRDHTHGRIWRITAKGRPLVKRPQLVGASTEALLAALQAPEGWTRHHAKRQLKERGTVVLPALERWVQQLDANDSNYEHHLLEALWTHQSLDVVNVELLKKLLRTDDYHARAAATRVLAHWHDRVDGAQDLLAVQVVDSAPRVRLEAVRALAQLRTARAAELAMQALDQPMDRFLDHALWLTARDLQPYWLPALERGEISFGGNPTHLTFALEAAGSPQVVAPLLGLLRSGELPAARQQSILVLLAALGGPDELKLIFDLARADEVSPERRAALLSALAKAAEQRKVRPAGDLEGLGELLNDQDAQVQLASARLAGLWQVETIAERLWNLGTAAKTAQPVRRAALEAIAALGGAAHRQKLIALSESNHPYELRSTAVAALTALDLSTAADRTVVVLADSRDGADPAAMIAALVDRKGGSDALAAALQGKKLPPDAAKLAIRAVRSAAREEPTLTALLSTAGNLDSPQRTLTPAELQALVAEVASQGNAARGENVFRRQDQACLKCHSIAGAGGRVAPDLVSIGASAQVDYLIESILQPSAKIKENYHSLVVTTDEGKIISGIKVRETDQELVLRDAEDREVAVPVTAIDERVDGGSLMPVGLADSLTRAELVDLVRFLSELGKVGPYATGDARVVRRWQALSNTPEALALLRDNGLQSMVTSDSAPGVEWLAAYSKVSGDLPIAELPAVPTSPSGNTAIVRCELEVTTPGKARLLLNTKPIKGLWIDDAAVDVAPAIDIPLTAGVHRVSLAVEAEARDEVVRVELGDVPGSPIQVQIVGGK